MAAVSSAEGSVGIIGLGYVGLPLAVAFAEAGRHVVGLEVSDHKVEAVGAGRSYVEDVASEDLARVVGPGRLEATTEASRLAGCEAVLTCVATPLGQHREPDLGYVTAAAEAAIANLARDALLVLESATWPGTTREVLAPILEAAGRTIGRDAYLAFSPERVDPGNARWGMRLLELLGAEGAQLSYHDPHVASLPTEGLDSIDLDEEAVRSADCVVIATAHSALDLALVVAHADLVVDLRNAVRQRLSGGTSGSVPANVDVL